MATEPGRWLLLLHQIPPRPAYARAKVQRRLKNLGALPVKNSAYLLPAGEDTLEDFQWLAEEVRSEGGEAWLFRADVLSGLSDAGLERGFQEISGAEYRAMAEDAARLLDDLRKDTAESAEEATHRRDARRLHRRWEATRRRDHFQAEAGKEVRALMDEIDRTLEGPRPATGEAMAAAGREDLSARTWVTRRNVKIDRIGSAWLIRRFIDPAAKFRFVEEPYDARPFELRFDMFEAEFTHRGSRCTFEVLVQEFALRNPALDALAEIVHQIDLKDDLYDRPEAAGVAVVIEGLVLREPDDARRIEEGCTIFDGLMERLGCGLDET